MKIWRKFQNLSTKFGYNHMEAFTYVTLLSLILHIYQSQKCKFANALYIIGNVLSTKMMRGKMVI